MTTDGSPRILVIDDELSICQNCIKILSKIDCEVSYALSGYDALRMMEAEPFEVIITDLKMSSLGGMEVLSRVKEAYPDTMVIVITGYASVSSAVEVMKMGAFDYLPKPFTPEELRGVVRQAVAERAIQLNLIPPLLVLSFPTLAWTAWFRACCEPEQRLFLCSFLGST